MAETIDELLVRLGLDTDEKEFKGAENMFDSLQTKALQFGAVIGGGLGLQELTFGFSETIDEMSRFAETFGVSAEFVDQLGFAFEQIGGNAKDAFSSIRTVADLIEQTEWGEIPSDAFREAGFDPYTLRGVSDVAEAYERIANATQGMDRESARRALSSLGFSEEDFRLFRQGAGQLRATMAEGGDLAPLTAEMQGQARDFQQGLNEVTRAMDGISRELSTMFVGDLGESMSDLAEFMKENRDAITKFAEDAMPFLKGIASGIGVLVGLRVSRAALGALSNVPGAVAITAGIGYGLSQLDTPGGTERSSPERPPMPLGRGRSGPDVPSHAEQLRRNTTINVDARGSNDPQETERAAERGARRALQESAENTVRDLDTDTK